MPGGVIWQSGCITIDASHSVIIKIILGTGGMIAYLYEWHTGVTNCVGGTVNTYSLANSGTSWTCNPPTYYTDVSVLNGVSGWPPGVTTSTLVGTEGSGPCQNCFSLSPVAVPPKNLTVSWSSSGIFGSGSGVLSYVFGSGYWQACIAVSSSKSIQFALYIGGGSTLAFDINPFTSNNFCGGTPINPGTFAANNWGEAPFHFGVNAAQGNVMWGLYGFSFISIDDNDIPYWTCNDTLTINVTGCNNFAVSGVPVSVYLGGTLFTSGTTDSSGQYTFASLGYSLSSFTFGVTSPRFVAFSGSTTGTIHLTPAAGYVCITGCGTPLSTTLHATHSLFGAITLTYSGGTSWTGSTSFSYGGYAGFYGNCAASTTTVSMNFSPTAGTLGPVTWITGGPGFPGHEECPMGGGTTGGTDTTVTQTSFHCPPAYSWTGTGTIQSGVSTTAQDLIYGADGNPAHTIPVVVSTTE
jgi:hypothetical protein